MTQTLDAGRRAHRGLSEAEAARRLHQRGPKPPAAGSRSYVSIFVANLATPFNAILAFFGALTLAFGDWRDALFLGIVVANTAIGAGQELRAKRALDRLSALVAPSATVLRDGRPRELDAGDVVPGDVALLEPGDQATADGTVLESTRARLDESVLTGESEPVERREGDEIRSGSFLTEGALSYEVTAVGGDSYAERLAGEARRFRHPRSPLELALNRLLLWLLAAMVPLAGALGISLALRHRGAEDTVSTATAAVVTLIPEGLILLASLAFAVAALRMTRRGALVQQLNAVESLAAADVICLDKTGTITEATLRVAGVVPAAGAEEGELVNALGRFGAASPVRNLTANAIADAFPSDAGPAEDSVPFSSEARWSAVLSGGHWYALGAPELFELDARLSEEARAAMRSGRRVLCIGQAESRGERPRDYAPLGLVTLAERLRPDAPETVAFLRSEGVELKVLSGDSPATVGAIAADAGISPPGSRALDGRELPESPAELAELLQTHAVVGRIAPEDKRRVVEALSESGRYVAMVGDGVNDVPALKAARLAIAQGSGAQMARSVADVVLVGGDFASLPAMVAEGRQILRNIQRVARLFVTKSVFAATLILTIGLSASAYPFLPRHLSLVATLTIGIPAFFLALAPSRGRHRLGGFLRSLFGFAGPYGVACAAGVLACYALALHGLDMSVLESRTVATTALTAFGLYLVVRLETGESRRVSRLVMLLVPALAALYLAALIAPFARHFFELAALSAGIAGLGLGGALLGVAVAFPLSQLARSRA